MYYSQNGEDYLINKIFPDCRDGFFVEVGCIDGKLFSNTMHLEEKGWKGLCVEAHAGYIEILSKNRPNSIVCHCAVGEKNQDYIPFYATERGSLSTLDPAQEDRWKKDFSQFFNGFTVQTVQMRTLTSVFLEHNVKEIDLLSIDIEGYEVQALKGLDLGLFQPKVIVIESDSPEHEKQISEILERYPYKKMLRLKENLFYVRDDIACNLEEGAHSVKLFLSGNPLIDVAPMFVTVQLTVTRRSGYGWNVTSSVQQREPLTSRFEFKEVGFHGDLYLLDVVDSLMSLGVEVFIETGTNIGTTLAYTAKHYPDVQCYSCEPSEEAYALAVQNLADITNAQIFNMMSQQFITDVVEKLDAFDQNVLFWLDAHGYGFEWPLREEVEYITRRFSKGLMLIDDFRVPGKEHFGYDRYQNQECSFDYIATAINPELKYTLYYPDYDDHTSKHHPLRGWGLIVWGFEIDSLIDERQLKIRKFLGKGM